MITLRDKLAFILKDAHESSDQYKLLLALLRTHESEVLALLAELRYPAALDPTHPKWEEVAMITRAMVEHYRHLPLAETIAKLEQLRPTLALHSTALGDIFLVTEGKENTASAYQWILENVNNLAALRSGTVIGGKLIDFDPEHAYEKTMHLPAGSLRAGALASVISSMAANDLQKAVNIINSSERTADLDQAITDLIAQSADRGLAPRDLVSLAAAPIDPAYRSSTLQSLFDDWARSDLATLQTWHPPEADYDPSTLAEIRLTIKQAIERHQTSVQ